MFGNRIKIEDELFEKIKACAAKAGYASPEEFIQHILEKEVERLSGGDREREAEEEVKKRLQGLGYIE